MKKLGFIDLPIAKYLTPASAPQSWQVLVRGY